MAKVHIKTDECEEIAKLLAEKSTSLSTIATGVQKTLHKIPGWSCNRTATSWSIIDRASKMAKSASDCIYQSVKIYNSAEKNVSGFENWLVDEELRKLNQTKKDVMDFINWLTNDYKETLKQSPYRMYLDGTWFVTPITKGWDYVVKIDGDDFWKLLGVDSEAEEIILRMCTKKELSVSAKVGSGLYEGVSDKAAFVDDFLSMVDHYEKLRGIREEGYQTPLTTFADDILDELYVKYDFPIKNLDGFDKVVKVVKELAELGEKDMAYYILLDTAAFKSLKPIIHASQDYKLIDTYYHMEYNLDNAFGMACDKIVADVTVEVITDGLYATPGVGHILLTKDVTAAGADVLFRTSDTAKAHNMMLKCRDISDSLAVSVDKALSAYNSSPTPENYASVMNAVKAHFEIETVGNQYAYELYEAMDKAWLKKEMVPEMMQILENYHGEEERIYNNILHVEGMQDKFSELFQIQKP